MLVNIIGLGNISKTLARLFVDNNLFSIAGIYNRTESKALSGIEFIGQGTYCKSIAELPTANLTFITTSDIFIKEASDEYSLNKNLIAGSIVVHCSGVLPASCMDAIRQKGCYICSVHPMHSFIDPVVSLQKYSGTYCAIEGDREATDIVSKLFVAIGSKVINIASDKKALYHAAGVFASNYLLTLANQALDCLYAAHVTKDDAVGIITSLMQSTVNNLLIKKNPSSALTGPLKRGDFATVNAHLLAFEDEDIKDTYKFMLDKTKKLLK